MQPPKFIKRRDMTYKTYWDVMDYKDREKVFIAYDYDPRKEVYEIKHPGLLTEDIIKKLS